MPEKYTGGSTISTAKTWATSLTAAINTGAYSSDAAGWLTGIDITDPVATSMLWAQDSNAFVCTTVMPNGVSAVENVDLAGDYYTSAMPVIEEQIAKAGYRYVIYPPLSLTY
jgi:nuclease S1